MDSQVANQMMIQGGLIFCISNIGMHEAQGTDGSDERSII
jgi:hypothetical protein